MRTRGALKLNEHIALSVREEPQHFLYLNNGLTAYCQRLEVNNLDRANAEEKRIRAFGFSIVNGAQTLGSIAGAIPNQPAPTPDGLVFVKVISLERCEDDLSFAERITRSTNFQNQIGDRDFVALDEQQERIANQLVLSGIAYHYKDADDTPAPDATNFTLEEATTACALLANGADCDFCARVLSNRRSFWSFDEVFPATGLYRSRYAKIFRPDISARTIWRAVQALRIVKAAMKTAEPGIQHLRTNHLEVVSLGRGGIEEARLEDYVVSGLVDFDDISYDDHADLLYDLAAQTVQHFRGYLSEEDTRKVLRCYQRDIARFIHAQMQAQYWEDVVGYEARISKGFTELKQSAYTYSAQEPPANYRVEPADKSNMAKYLFGGFKKCLYPVQKFDSDSERKLAVILEREALKWFKPAKGQFQIYYRNGADHLEYQPDFVAETADTIYMLEPKKRTELEDSVVIAKQEAAVKWCANASEHAAGYCGKPWRYVLIPHDEIAENITLDGLAVRFGG